MNRSNNSYCLSHTWPLFIQALYIRKHEFVIGHLIYSYTNIIAGKETILKQFKVICGCPLCLAHLHMFVCKQKYV